MVLGVGVGLGGVGLEGGVGWCGVNVSWGYIFFFVTRERDV